MLLLIESLIIGLLYVKTVEIVTKYRTAGAIPGEKMDIDILKKVTFQSYLPQDVL